MKAKKNWSASILSLTLALLLCGAPELTAAVAQAQQSPPEAAQQPPSTTQSDSQTQPAPLPDAPSSQPANPTASGSAA